MAGSIEDALKAGSDAADSIGKLGNATPAHFNQIISLCLLACVIGLAAYEFTLGRPQLVHEMQAGHEQGRQEFKTINDANMSKFESIMATQERSHEKVVELITGGKLKLSASGTNNISETN